MQKNKIVASIAGRDYPLSGVESEEYLHRVAIYVDRKIQEVLKSCPQLSTSDAAVLAAVNVADELLKLRDDYAELDKRISQLREVKPVMSPSKKPFEVKSAMTAK